MEKIFYDYKTGEWLDSVPAGYYKGSDGAYHTLPNPDAFSGIDAEIKRNVVEGILADLEISEDEKPSILARYGL